MVIGIEQKFGADKTKITIVGSKVDEKHYLENFPWKMGWKKIEMNENNKLGLSWAKLSCIGARIYLSQIYFYLVRFSYG